MTKWEQRQERVSKSFSWGIFRYEFDSYSFKKEVTVGLPNVASFLGDMYNNFNTLRSKEPLN